MGIKRPTFYYQAKDNQDKEQHEVFIKDKIKDISYQHPHYGYRRITAQLKREKVAINQKRVLRMMRQMGIQAKIKRKYARTTNSKHHNRIYPHFIKDKIVTGINQVWCSDITYIYTQQGWLYLVTIIDLYSRKIIGWSLRDRLTKELVISALNMALKQRKLSSDLLLHLDRGNQYASELYQLLLSKNGILCSMSGKGNCCDNAVMESFYHTLKVELIYQSKYKTRIQAKRDIFEYIEIFYNRKITFIYRLLQSGGIRENNQGVLTECPDYRRKIKFAISHNG